MEDEQKKGDKESAKYIEDAIKKAMNGINPVTGKLMKVQIILLI